ncbi:MAG: hypothetical protein WCL70_12580 [Paludibacter sp.]
MRPRKIQQKINSKPVQFQSNFKSFFNLENKYIWISFGILYFITILIYRRVAGYGLLLGWDDMDYVTKNTDIQSLNWTSVKNIFSGFYEGNYQPLTILFYAIQYWAGNGSSVVFHSTNILFHLLNTFLVYVFIRKLSPKNSIVAFITAALFAVHPMHVESVAWVSEFKDVLYAFFFLLGLVEYLKFVDSC